MVYAIPQNAGWDTIVAPQTSMNEDKVMEILVRLERLDAGQIHVIGQLSDLKAERQATADRIRLNAERIQKVENRIDRVEWQQGEQKERVRPWRHFAFTVGASVIAAVLISWLLHH